jgi:transposase
VSSQIPKASVFLNGSLDFALVVGAVDSHQQIVLPPRRFGFESFRLWAAEHLGPSDAVVLEATSNAWLLHDQLESRVARVTVANPVAVKLISSARVKTDASDTLKLARLLAADLIAAVWVPPLPVRELRALIAHRKRLIKQQTQARTRLHGVLQRQNIEPPAGKAFAAGAHAWWLSLPLSPSEHLRVRQDLTLLDALAPLIAEVERELGTLSTSEQWKGSVPLLLQLPGIGMLLAMTLLAAIGEISRFPSANHLVGYAGLGARVHACGQVQRTGRITKEGRSELRAALVEAAWIASEHHPHWKKLFEQRSRTSRQAKSARRACAQAAGCCLACVDARASRYPCRCPSDCPQTGAVH